MKHLSAVLFCIILGNSMVLGQNTTPILERKISITANNEKITSALNRIGQAGGFSFSYNSAIISAEQTITLSISEKSVREVLNEIFQGTMNYKEKSNYLIITKAPVPVTKNNIVVIMLNGYVEDSKTGEKIAQASVYDKSSVASTITDEYGYFKLRLEKKATDSVDLSVSKKNYRDTLVSITAPDNQYLKISITPVKDTVIIAAQTTPIDSGEVDENTLTLPYEDEPNVQNIHDTLYQMVQVSLLPFIGSNDRLSGNVINDYSINFFGGYSMGTRQIELGFFVNIDRADVSWLQVAGFGNLVGRNVYGIQAAGFANVNGGETKAIQLSGFANTNLGESIGVQITGFANTNLKGMNGVQFAGLTNVTVGESKGVQVSGLGNVQVGDYRGSQIAGGTNIATAKISGSQVSALFNHAKEVHGTQIGLVNYADTLGGIPIGLLSIVKTGYHKIELSADEVFYTNLAFRSGVRKFYTMLQAGFKPDKSLNAGDSSVWTFGYGLGTARRISKKIFLNIDASAQHVNKGSFTNALSLLNKIHVGFDFQLTKGFSLYTGATLNGYLTDNDYKEYPTLFTDFNPTVFYDETVGTNNNLKMWLGAKVALRFL
jgi:hypothetical protein